MKREKPPILLSAAGLLALVALAGCRPDEEFDKYARPDWLAGKVFTQVQSAPDLSSFATALQMTGYDTVINVSGSYTVFAPTDDAFDQFFQENTAYNSLEDVPKEELDRLVKYHIVQNPWSRDQLRSLDVWGWIDPADEQNDEPRGFKRETLLRDPDFKYGVARDDDYNMVIVDTLESNWYRRVDTDSRKFAPLFFQQYFSIYNLKSEDYAFYFDRPIEGGEDLYFVSAKLVGEEIFAENGFVQKVDRVVSPLRNGYQILTDSYSDRSFDMFVDLVHQFPDFEYNEEATFDQPGADQGLAVDSLFDLTFPDLVFNLTMETTKAPRGTLGLPPDVTIRYHHGMMIPTDAAIVEFENTYMPGGSFWNGLDRSPRHMQRIFVNSHLCIHSVYKTDIEGGFFNGEEDIVTLDESQVIQKEFGSNTSFLGLNEVIVPGAFKSITGPVYLRRGFSKTMYAIERSGLLAALKTDREPHQQYSFYVESDANTSLDSSLFYNESTDEFFAYVRAGLSAQRINFSTKDLRTLLLNHVGARTPAGMARREFIPTLGGNYLIIDNETGEVSGTSATTEGFRGQPRPPVIPTILSDEASNGITYEIDDWFSFASASIYSRIQSEFPEFHDLIVNSGLANTNVFQYTFLTEGENYTVFAPTAEALLESGVDTLSQEKRQEFILLHFIQKEIVFTDGSSPAGYYETSRRDESSTEFTTVYTSIYMEPGIDEISFPASSGGVYYTLSESDSTNLIAGRSLSEGNVAIPEYISTAVIHATGKALKLEDLNVYNPTAR